VYVRVETKALFGHDIGKIRVGYIKTPVGMDALTSSRSVSMQELSLPNQAFYAGRRTGVEWSREKPHWFAQIGAYGGKDLQGDNPGTMQAARFVWNPVKDKDEVIHVGLAASLENPRGWQDGRGISHVRTSRFRSRPEAGLTDVRLIDSGALPYTDSILRTGLEGAWRRGPLYLQGEALQAQVNRGEGKPDYRQRPVHAGRLCPDRRSAPVFGRRVRQHQAHPQLRRGGAAGPLQPAEPGRRQHPRQPPARLDLRRQLVSHQPLQVQANYVKADATRNGVHVTPDAVELRAGDVLIHGWSPGGPATGLPDHAGRVTARRVRGRCRSRTAAARHRHHAHRHAGWHTVCRPGSAQGT
jgi:phosphate-selective porin OprO/OprP